MRNLATIAVLSGWLSLTRAAGADVGLPEGTWDFNGTAYEGKLVLKVGDGGEMTGTVYDQPIVGSFDAATARINFLRLCVPNDPSTSQSHKGYLFANQVGSETRYTLAGSFYNIGDTAEMGWYAQIGVADVPVTGPDAPGVELLDAVMQRSLKKIGASGAALTVTWGARTLYSRGYGWSDRDHTLAMQPDTPIVIASCDMPLTAAMIRQMARDGKLHLDDSEFRSLKIKPRGAVVDDRIWDITFQHLLDMSPGWQGEPMARAWESSNGSKFPIDPEDFRGWVMVQRLAWTPGEKSQYDSASYNLMKLAVTRLSGHGYVDYLRHELFRPFGIKELKWVRHGQRREGEPPQLSDGLIMEDPEEYRMGVSVPAMCTFMRHFWQDGQPRDGRSRPTFWPMIGFGGWSNSTAILWYRPDVEGERGRGRSSLSLACVFDKGGDGAAVLGELQGVIEQLIKERRLPR